jgi:hypothetical protein
VNSRVTAASREPVTAGQLTIVPANETSWADLQAVFGQVARPSPRRVVMRVAFTGGG